jgi:hypothetical protein
MQQDAPEHFSLRSKICSPLKLLTAGRLRDSRGEPLAACGRIRVAFRLTPASDHWSDGSPCSLASPVFSLADHAGNGFFNPLEWMPVVASAIAVGFLAVPLIM